MTKFGIMLSIKQLTLQHPLSAMEGAVKITFLSPTVRLYLQEFLN